MTFTAPKNDAARKTWLRGLKDGDEVAVISKWGVTIQTVTLRLTHHEFRAGGARYTAATGKLISKTQSDGWLVPVTDDDRRVIAATTARERIIGAMSSSGLRQFTDDQILKVAAILWPPSATP